MCARKKAEYPLEPDYAVAPGATLLETIESLGMDQRELSDRTGLATKTVNQIIKGKAPITHETALKLEQATGVPAHFWNNLETNYREALARAKERTRLESQPDWLKDKAIPVRELVRRRCIDDAKDKAELLRSVLAFFGVSSTSAWEKLWLRPQVAYRKSRCFEARPGACAAWLRMGEVEAQQIACSSFDRRTFMGVLGKIRTLTAEMPPNFDRLAREMCATAGVALTFIPEIKGAPVSGATEWLTPEKALVVLSLRYKSDDQFWFSFFHEAGHILKGSKKAVYIDAKGNKEDKAEREANAFASNFLIPPGRADELRGLKSKAAIIGYAHSLGIAPGIVVGQLHNRGFAHYKNFQGLKRKLQWASS